MIRIYCQYSYGGFKTFHIQGKENEEVCCEVTSDNSYNFPNDAWIYFQYGGSKIIYRYLNNNRIALIIREIPCTHRDGDGRKIPCAVQFIGDIEDRKTLDYIALDIANDILKFEEFFSNLFYIQQGLYIDGQKLINYINDRNVNFKIETKISQLQNIIHIQSGIILFIHLSNNFGIDDFVTQKVCKELNLNIKELKSKKCTIPLSELLKLQGKTTISISNHPQQDVNRLTLNSKTPPNIQHQRILPSYFYILIGFIIAGLITAYYLFK